MRQEGPRTANPNALIDSVAADLPDLGHELAVPDSGRVLWQCRHVALRRASGNLQGNAAAHCVRATARVWGLSIARTIICGRDGVIRLENPAEGRSSATVVLPGREGD